MIRSALALLAALAAAAALARAPAAEDRHAGYYYPKPASIEAYKSPAATLKDMDRARRIAFVVEVVEQMLARPYPPQFSLFAKGDYAEKLIVVGNVAGRLDTVYRARALLATLTSIARATPLFAEERVEDLYTFLDFLKMLGFKQVTVSDGAAFAHQVTIE
jgi:hypothetical protein